jgi:hypothetical protein
MRNFNATTKCMKGRQSKIFISHIGKSWKEFMNENKFKFGDELLFILVLTNSTNVGTSSCGVICKKFRMLLLHDHSGCTIVLVPFQRQLKNNYLIFKPNYFLTTSFSY